LWFSWGGIGGKGAMAAGFLTAVFMYSGWDGTVYVNEETRKRRMNPGRAAVIAVGLVGFFYVFSQIGLQGVVSPTKLQANGSSALVYLGGVMHGSAGSQTAAFAVALSVVAATLAGILLTARIAYGSLAAAALGRRYRPARRAGAAGCVGITALDSAMLITVMLAAPVLIWPVILAAAASAARFIFTARALRPVPTG
jgi:Amino acid permease